MKAQLNPSCLFLFVAFLFVTHSFSQTSETFEFGNPDNSEIGTYTYPKDPEAAAVILYEKGETEVKVIDDYLWLVTKVHVKTKVLNAKEYGDAVIEITYYHPEKGGERIEDLKAVTHNGAIKQFVRSGDFFEKDLGGGWKSLNFTFPDLKDQSLLEYTYTKVSPYFQNFHWYFQEKYPKVYSEYITEIPGNYVYRIGFRGFLKFDTHDQRIKKSCFAIDGLGGPADCYYNRYIIKNIPAFKEEEYMLSKDNYTSQLRYELKEHMNFRGEKTFYTKRWEDVDDEFHYDKEMGRQLNNKNFFRKNLPEELFAISDPLERAKAIYYAIQKHYTWNNKYRIFNEIDVREAFERGTGNIAEINLSLITALQEAELDAYIALSATREESIPTELYPVLTEYNYVMGYLKIGDSFYFLDATNKFTPFGIISYKALNYRARIMDFKNGSYWHPIIPFDKNQHYLNARLSFDENHNLIGEVNEINSGYFGLRVREYRSSMDEDDYLERKGSDIFLEDYSIENEHDLEEPVKEHFTIEKEFTPISDTEAGQGIGKEEYYVHPFFLMRYLNENPFKLEEREYPVDFGYPMNITCLVAIDLGDGFTAKFVPENKTFKMPEDLGSCQVMYHATEQTLSIRLQIRQNRVHLTSEYYDALKKFYTETVTLITKDVLVLEKS